MQLNTAQNGCIKRAWPPKSRKIQPLFNIESPILHGHHTDLGYYVISCFQSAFLKFRKKRPKMPPPTACVCRVHHHAVTKQQRFMLCLLGGATRYIICTKSLYIFKQSLAKCNKKKFHQQVRKVPRVCNYSFEKYKIAGEKSICK